MYPAWNITFPSTDISSKYSIMASNNPDINNSYTLPHEYFYTQNEAFFLTALHTPNDFEDAALLLGVTYSDHHADIHITPTSLGCKKP